MFLRPGHGFFTPYQPKTTPKMLQPDLSSASQKKASSSSEPPFLLAQFDLAGTSLDRFCLIPYFAFKKTFANIAPELSHEQITGPMGMDKKQHISWLLRLILKREPSPEEVNTRYNTFLSILRRNIRSSFPTPFIKEALEFLKEKGIPCTWTTGYDLDTAMAAMTELNKIASFATGTAANKANQGNRLRMLLDNMEKLGIPEAYISRTLFFTDSKKDIMDVRAGELYPWTIAVLEGTHFRIESMEELSNMSAETLEERRQEARKILQSAKPPPHLIIDKMSKMRQVYHTIRVAQSKGLTPMNTESLELLDLPGEELDHDRSLGFSAKL